MSFHMDDPAELEQILEVLMIDVTKTDVQRFKTKMFYELAGVPFEVWAFVQIMRLLGREDELTQEPTNLIEE